MITENWPLFDCKQLEGMIHHGHILRLTSFLEQKGQTWRYVELINVYMISCTRVVNISGSGCGLMYNCSPECSTNRVLIDWISEAWQNLPLYLCHDWSFVGLEILHACSLSQSYLGTPINSGHLSFSQQ